MIASSSSAFVWTESIDRCRHTENFYALFIIGGSGIRGALREERLIHWLRRAVPHSQFTFSITDGQLLFEAAVPQRKFLREAHADRVGHLADRSPGIRHSHALDPLQTALNVIQSDLGIDIAKRIAAGVVPARETQFSSVVRRIAALNVSDRVQASARWLATNGARQVSIAEAAQVAAMSERNFLRRFKIEVGITPSDYLLYVRLDMCCRMLVETELPIRTIALRCGINGGGRLSKLFRQHLATTPTAYRLHNRVACPEAVIDA